MKVEVFECTGGSIGFTIHSESPIDRILLRQFFRQHHDPKNWLGLNSTYSNSGYTSVSFVHNEKSPNNVCNREI